MNSNSRIYWIDWTKVFLIYLMILGHIGTTDLNIRQLLYTFHMPCFFIISGYLHKQGSTKTIFKYLFTPVLIISIFCFIYRCINLYFVMNIPFSINIYIFYPLNGLILAPTSGISADIFTGLWYIENLLVLKILFSNIQKTFLHFIILLITITYTSLKYFQFWTFSDALENILLERIFYCYFFFYVGYYIKKFDLLRNNSQILLSNKNIVIFIPILILLIFLSSKSGFIDIYNNQYGKVSILFYIIPCCWFVMFHIFFTKISSVASLQSTNQSVIQTLSNGTLLILGTHSIVLQCFLRLQKHLGITFPYWFTGILTLVILYLPIYICERKFPIILGKKKRRTI